MPFHSKQTLEHWVAEFVDARGAGEEVRVAVQDGHNGQDTGLVVMPQVAAELCAFLQERSLGHYEPEAEPRTKPEATTAE
ncbi:hypothetical protein J2X55_003460 [Microbacterium sp. 1154]|uniref:hypothetical protein n=1 Tax=Microbacterium sp. 1154 TaxID=2817733 RepID=UPI00286247D4|nr:hypothetical protein [Microbacterium sp. 1154]MDR6692515.1 hypothetical protein [Microbacterium sp. 1154]